jgi:valyl-tRNA synthetase
MLHPFIPFATEKLWNAFGYEDKLIGRSDWPVASHLGDGEQAKSEMGYLQNIIRAMRNLRAEVKLPPQKMAPLMSLRLRDAPKKSLLEDNRDLVTLMARVDEVKLGAPGAPKPPKSIATVTTDWELLFPVGGLMDVEREIARFQDELDKLELEMKRVRGKLENKNFIAKAPPEVVEKERAALEEGLARKGRIEENLEGLRQS